MAKKPKQVYDERQPERDQSALLRERNLLRTLIDNLPDFIYVKDAERRFITANPAVARLMGVKSPDDLIGKRDEDFYPERAAAQFKADEEKVFHGEPVISKSEPNTDHHGRVTEILTTKVPLRDNAGKIVGLVGISRDITELKQRERDLQETLSQVKTLQGLLPICAFCHKIRNDDGRWEKLESYISSRTDTSFTHGFCPDCGEKHYSFKSAASAPPAA